MKFSVSSSELLSGLMSVSKVIAPKPTKAILENYLFELNDSALTVTASDGETTLRTNIPISRIERPGSTAVPAKLLTDSLKEFPDQPLVFSIEEGSSTMDITWSSGASKLPCYDAADYPQIPAIQDSARNVVINASALLNGINNTIYATAEEELRPVMNGIYFDMETSSATLVASDAHKLVCYTFSNIQAPCPMNFILHKKPAAILRGLLSKYEEEVAIRFDSKNAHFTFGENILVCRLIEGNYPAYRTVLPKNNSNKLTIGRSELLGVVKRIAVCSNQVANQVKFKLSYNELVISAQDLSFSMSAYETLACQYDGDEMEIGFKSAFLLEILSNLPYRNICMELADPARAALIVSADESDAEEDIKALLMPVMINA